MLQPHRMTLSSSWDCLSIITCGCSPKGHPLQGPLSFPFFFFLASNLWMLNLQWTDDSVQRATEKQGASQNEKNENIRILIINHLHFSMHRIFVPCWKLEFDYAVCFATSVILDSLWPCGLWLTRLHCPWDSLSKNTGVGCHLLLQGIFPTQGLKRSLLCLLHWQAGSLQLAPPGKPVCS